MDDKQVDVVHVDEYFGPELSDEALEALDNKNLKGAYTLGSCTGLSVCPA